MFIDALAGTLPKIQKYDIQLSLRANRQSYFNPYSVILYAYLYRSGHNHHHYCVLWYDCIWLWLLRTSILIIFDFYMRNQKEWASNRGYIQHLEVLKKISSRNIRINRKASAPRLHKIEANSNDFDDRHDKAQNVLVRCPTVKEKQLLWENYYLGKRIIETPPVISKRKLDQDFKRHQRLVECLTSSSTRKPTNELRVKKLQEYKENLEQQNDDANIQLNRNIIKLNINNLVFFRQRPALDNIDLLFSYASKNGKAHRQNSQKFPAEEILERHFYFGISKRLTANEEALTVQLRNLKGLSEISIGHFSFPSLHPLQAYKSQLFHCGKIVGEVNITTSYNRRAHYKTVDLSEC